MKFSRRHDPTGGSVALHSVLALGALGAAACGHGKPDPCAGAVRHAFELVGGNASKDEQQAIDAVAKTTLGKCQQEGLSQPVADCILAARGPDWSDQLRGCPAFAARPASWVALGPSRDDRRKLLGKPPIPDGPRTSPVSFVEIVASRSTTCGLTRPGKIQCWGEKLDVLDGTFVHLRADPKRLCGLDPSGIVACTNREPLAMRTPPDPLSDFDIAEYRGCGVLRSSNMLTCWNDLDDAGLQPPAGLFVAVVLRRRWACALDIDQHVKCFGDSAPSVPSEVRATALAAGDTQVCGVARDGKVSCWGEHVAEVPTSRFVTVSCAGRQCCGVTDTRDLRCWGPPEELRAPPAGKFASVAVLGGHSCAVRADGGTVCWGNNDDGQCNVPQDAASHWY